ncbi:ABC-type Fe3+ transport system protein [Fimbriimonas ginsengisoli Gsoil 348]|uniref:ABC-type Fe3+ transport system protein n=2 Tax=Fimbriimonas ginsengisoli TaxID=1005039 RepID=A0A068NQD6_FIMGI|nr:ABC-type Fe3+ transport system protein [Fimbriimonas ginsengisoli Gsoil 348]
MAKTTSHISRALALGSLAIFVAGCNTDMWRQPRHEPLDASEFFADGAANRPLVPGSIPRGHLREDAPFFTGIQDGHWVDKLPMPVTADLIKRGQDRFRIYCTPCHGQLGDGNGMISKRGFALRRPPGNYHTDRLRKMPVGHFYDVITNGYGAMYSYASRIEPQDRWAVVAYIRALQLSQNATPADADPVELEKSTHPAPAEAASGEGAKSEG